MPRGRALNLAYEMHYFLVDGIGDYSISFPETDGNNLNNITIKSI